MMDKVKSFCNKCNEVSFIENKGEKIVFVTCKNGHTYEHIIDFSVKSPMVRDSIDMKLKEMEVKHIFHRMTDKTTACTIIFNNGIEVTGVSTVKDAADFHLVDGQDQAYKNAFAKAKNELAAFLL